MPHTVLIVDDEDSVRAAWERALRHAGYHVLTAGTGQQALKLCDEHAIDVVVLDFIMPSIDGVVVSRIFRTLVGGPVWVKRTWRCAA